MSASSKTKTAVASVSILLVAAAAATAVIGIPQQLSSWPVSAPLGESSPTYEMLTVENEEPVENEQYALYEGLNKAIEDGDREAFISWGKGEGKEQLARWWDLTKSIGWTNAAVTGSPQILDETNLEIYMGTQLGFPVQSLRKEEKGLDLLQGEYFDAEIEGVGSQVRILNLKSRHNLFAWSDFPETLHVEKRKYVIVVGWEEDKDYLSALADRAEVVANESFKLLGESTENYPTSGYVIQSSGDPENLSRWLGGKNIPENWAGLAVPTQRPASNNKALDPRFATGLFTSGSTIVMRPDLQDSSVDAVILHEMFHVLHRSAMPVDLKVEHDDSSSAEGYARNMQRSLDSPAMTNWMLSQAQPFVAELGYGAFSLDNIRGPEASIAYSSAAYMYDYAESLGVGKWKLALEATNSGEDFYKTVERLTEGKATEAGYKEFVANLKPIS